MMMMFVCDGDADADDDDDDDENYLSQDWLWVLNNYFTESTWVLIFS